MKNTFKELYNSIITESKNNLTVVKETAKKKIIDQQEKISSNNNKKTETEQIKEQEIKDNNIKEKPTKITSMENDFISKFVRYNELQILKNELPKITEDLKAIDGFDSQAIDQEIQKTIDDRQTELDSLIKELTDLRNSINKEAEEINYKKSIIDLFDGESSKAITNQDTTKDIYGYKSPETNIETLPANSEPDKIDDLQQATQLSADALEPDTDVQLKKSDEQILIDSKKKK